MNTMKDQPLPEWEQVLSAAARLQTLLPEAVLVGGTASAIHASHRFSRDADHVLTDLRVRFDEILAELESVAGWQTARVQRPVLILGSLDGIETGVRQLIRKQPLETTEIEAGGARICIPTLAEILRIKGVLILKRNATRDYLDFVALVSKMSPQDITVALAPFDALYPQPNGQSALQQLHIQLAQPLPYDLEVTQLSEYKNLAPQWHDWHAVQHVCMQVSTQLFDQLSSASAPEAPQP
jgi:Nucleotidyl transferase AbiEii toxin, Type IV TA system